MLQRSLGRIQHRVHLFPIIRSNSGATTTASSPHTEPSSTPINKQVIIRKALQYVNDYGWNDECLVRAVQELQLPPLTHRIVTRGAAEMVQQVQRDKLDYVRQAMETKYPDSASMATFDGDRLRDAIELHIDYLKPFHSHWAEAIAVAMTPSELPHTTQNIFKLSDDLCHFSGIRATRMDWYYERAVITALYTATELFLLTDHSENFQETKAFLGQSMEHYRTARMSPMSAKNIFWKMTSK